MFTLHSSFIFFVWLGWFCFVESQNWFEWSKSIIIFDFQMPMSLKVFQSYQDHLKKIKKSIVQNDLKIKDLEVRLFVWGLKIYLISTSYFRILMVFCIPTAQNLFHMLLLVRMIIQLGTLKLYCVEKNLKTFIPLHKSQQKRVLFCILNIEDPPFCARCSEHVCKLSFFIE